MKYTLIPNLPLQRCCTLIAVWCVCLQVSLGKQQPECSQYGESLVTSTCYHLGRWSHSWEFTCYHNRNMGRCMCAWCVIVTSVGSTLQAPIYWWLIDRKTPAECRYGDTKRKCSLGEKREKSVILLFSGTAMQFCTFYIKPNCTRTNAVCSGLHC